MEKVDYDQNIPCPKHRFNIADMEENHEYIYIGSLSKLISQKYRQSTIVDDKLVVDISSKQKKKIARKPKRQDVKEEIVKGIKEWQVISVSKDKESGKDGIYMEGEDLEMKRTASGTVIIDREVKDIRSIEGKYRRHSEGFERGIA